MSKASFKELFNQKVWRFVKPHIGKVLVALVFSLLASAASGAIAWLVKPVIDSIFVEKKYSVLTGYPLPLFFSTRSVGVLILFILL